MRGWIVALLALCTTGLPAFASSGTAKAAATCNHGVRIVHRHSIGNIRVGDLLTAPQDCPPSCGQEALQLATVPPGSLHIALTTATVLDLIVNAHGKVTNIKLVQTSGFRRLDEEAYSAAKSSTYSPAMHDCRPTSGTYSFVQHWDRGTH